MDIRDRLLHNEIQNLGQMLQIVSYELTLLSDFMKEQFGASYENFRARHNQEGGDDPGKRKMVTARKSTSGHLKRPVDDDEVLEGKRRREDDHDDFEVEEEDDGPLSEVDIDMPEGAQLVKFKEYRTPDEKVTGRQRSGIWSKFVVSKLSNGKYHTVCPRCGKQVSSKVERLTGHYRKCIEAEVEPEVGSGVGGKVTVTGSQLEEEDKRKVAEYIMELKSGEGGEDGGDPLKEKGGESGGGGGGRKGRASDPVWEYFRVLEDPETKKKLVKCKRCNVAVSSKVERVRRHFVICNELDKEGSGGG